MIPALLCNNKVVTGSHHGDAFSKLNEQEKNSDIISGFIENNKFITDNQIIYLKEFFLIRHANAEPDGPITPIGIQQAKELSKFLQGLNLNNFVALSSPFLRCKETANILFNLNYQTCDFLGKCSDVKVILEEIPEKSILVTHSDIIQNILLLTNQTTSTINNCSVTYICKNRIVWLAREINSIT